MSDFLPTERRFSAPAGAPVDGGAPQRTDYIRNGSADYYPAEGAEPLQLQEVVRVLRRHWLLVLASTLLFTGAAAYLVSTAVPEYRAAATLRMQDERRALSGGLEAAAMEQVMGKQTDPLLSQIQVLRSRNVGGAVVDRLGLGLRPLEGALPRRMLEQVEVAPTVTNDTLTLHFAEEGVVLSDDREETRAAYGEPVRLHGVSLTLRERPEGVEKVVLEVVERDRAIDWWLERLKARPLEKTDVVQVEFVSPDPHLAQQVVNTTSKVFRALSVEAAQQQSRRRREFVEAQLIQADSVLAGAQQALSDFQAREQVFSSRESFAAQQAGLLTLEVRRQEMDAERGMHQQLLNELLRPRRGSASDGLRTLVSAPGVAENRMVSDLYAQLMRYEMSRDSMIAVGASRTNADFERLSTLIASTEARLTDAVRSHVQSLQARISALDEMRGRTTAELRGMPQAQAEEARLLQQLDAVRKGADQLREESQKARIAEAIEAGQVDIVDLAPLPAEPIGSGRSLKLVLALMLGLMVGGGGAFIREHLNTRIRRKEDMEELLHVPALAVIPRLARNAEAKRGKLQLPGRIVAAKSSNGKGAVHAGLQELVAVSDVRSPGAEAFRTLRTNLIFSQAVESLRTIVVTSATPSDGKTTTSSNLAVTFAQQGLRVLLVDCDLRRGRLHHVFGLPQSPGLTELVLGHSSPEAVLRATPVEGLSVLTSGTLPPNPAELLAGPRTMRTLELLREQFDLVILDTAPLTAAADASVLGLRSDGVLLVVRAAHTERAAVQQSMQQLRSVGARVIGAVLNDPDAETQRYGGYYYHEYYGAKEAEASPLSPSIVGTPS